MCVYRKNNVQFATVITRLQESPQCQRLPFMSFLLLPFQRITRIKMLIEVSKLNFALEGMLLLKVKTTEVKGTQQESD